MDMADLGNVKKEFESAARSFQTDFTAQAAEVEREVRDAQTAIEKSLDTAAPPSPQMELGIEQSAPPLPPKGPGEQ
jgi:hypothetical protein